MYTSTKTHQIVHLKSCSLLCRNHTIIMLFKNFKSRGKNTCSTPGIKMYFRKFFGSPVVRTQCFHCQGPGSITGWGTKIHKLHGVTKRKMYLKVIIIKIVLVIELGEKSMKYKYTSACTSNLSMINVAFQITGLFNWKKVFRTHTTGH